MGYWLDPRPASFYPNSTVQLWLGCSTPPTGGSHTRSTQPLCRGIFPHQQPALQGQDSLLALLDDGQLQTHYSGDLGLIWSHAWRAGIISFPVCLCLYSQIPTDSLSNFQWGGKREKKIFLCVDLRKITFLSVSPSRATELNKCKWGAKKLWSRKYKYSISLRWSTEERRAASSVSGSNRMARRPS